MAARASADCRGLGREAASGFARINRDRACPRSCSVRRWSATAGAALFTGCLLSARTTPDREPPPPGTASRAGEGNRRANGTPAAALRAASSRTLAIDACRTPESVGLDTPWERGARATADADRVTGLAATDFPAPAGFGTARGFVADLSDLT